MGSAVAPGLGARGCAGGGGQRARPAEPADSTASTQRGGGSVVGSPEWYRVPETNQTDNIPVLNDFHIPVKDDHWNRK